MVAVVDERKLSAAEAAELAGVVPQTIRRWHKEGFRGVRLDAVFVGRQLVTSYEAVFRFLTTLNAPPAGAAEGAGA